MILVFGSINVDLAMRVERAPQRGETVLTREAILAPGGKGANQANAAARFGAEVAMAGAVGADGLAETALSVMRASGVDVTRVRATAEAVTGCAAIWVDAEGGSTIVVASGANWHAREADVEDALLARTRVLLLQNEVPAEESWRLAARARGAGCRVLYSNAPAGPLPAEAMAHIDTLLVNEIEARQTAAGLGLAAADPEQAARALAAAHPVTVIMTLGADGSVAHREGETIRQPALRVRPVDTTAAGDTYAGVLAAAWAASDDLAAAMRLASAAASLACTKVGAQGSQPSREEIVAAASQLA